MSGTTPILAVEDLHFTWPGGIQALRGVTFKLDPGESLALVGPNGAGKSTTLLATLGFLRPTGGEIRVNGMPLAPENHKAVRRMVGAVFQDPDDQLFMSTLTEDVAFGPLNLGLTREEALNRANRALADVGLAGMGDRPPGQLSGGEKRRAAIATVLAMEPSLLILDEPASNLDPRSRRQLIDLLAPSPLARLLITHDLEMVLDLCPRVILMDQGRIITTGPAIKILADRELMAAHGLEVPYSLHTDHTHRLGPGDDHHADHHARGLPHRHHWDEKTPPPPPE